MAASKHRAGEKLLKFQLISGRVESRLGGLLGEPRQPPERHGLRRDERLGDLAAIEGGREQIGRDGKRLEAGRDDLGVVQFPVAVMQLARGGVDPLDEIPLVVEVEHLDALELGFRPSSLPRAWMIA